MPEMPELPLVLQRFGEDLDVAMAAAATGPAERGRRHGLPLRAAAWRDGPPRSRLVGYGPLTNRARRWSAVALIAAIAGTCVLVIGTTGGGPTTAFAGWSATPTAPAPGQVAAAQTVCRRNDTAIPGAEPTVADTRGPFSLLVYAQPATTTICFAGLPGADAVLAPGQAVLAQSEVAAAQSTTPGTITTENQVGLVVTPSGNKDFMVLAGLAGAGVTSVSLTLKDGSTVAATIANGWFVAWWPGSQAAESAAVTTASGATTRQATIVPPALYAPVPQPQPGGVTGTTTVSGPSATAPGQANGG